MNIISGDKEKELNDKLMFHKYKIIRIKERRIFGLHES